MNRDEILEKLFNSFQIYYSVERENIDPPFVAEAQFHTHDEQFFLVKSAVISEAESQEYVYFASEERLDLETLLLMDQEAWNRGISNVKPHASHRNTDVALIILADKITDEAFLQIPKLRHYRSYRLGFQGWSNYRLVAIELSTGRAAYNRLGRSFKKLVRNIT